MGAMVELLNEVCKEANLKIRLLDANNNEIYDNLPATESKVMRKISVNSKAYKIILEQDDIKIIPIVEYVLNKCIKRGKYNTGIIRRKKTMGCFK